MYNSGMSTAVPGCGMVLHQCAEGTLVLEGCLLGKAGPSWAAQFFCADNASIAYLENASLAVTATRSLSSHRIAMKDH